MSASSPRSPSVRRLAGPSLVTAIGGTVTGRLRDRRSIGTVSGGRRSGSGAAGRPASGDGSAPARAPDRDGRRGAPARLGPRRGLRPGAARRRRGRRPAIIGRPARVGRAIAERRAELVDRAGRERRALAATPRRRPGATRRVCGPTFSEHLDRRLAGERRAVEHGVEPDGVERDDQRRVGQHDATPSGSSDDAARVWDWPRRRRVDGQPGLEAVALDLDLVDAGRELDGPRRAGCGIGLPSIAIVGVGRRRR